ncbi:MAG TPA: diaminobutyrate acetyltransferase [Kiloniellales bacterium]|nr:diaminobutyrate acetyltransferase [Kiloniellales bacterium]
MQLLEADEDTREARRIAPPAEGLRFRAPSLEDGKAVQDLIASCATLDDNSLYCNFLQCTHFADTCLLVEQEQKLLGWISAYRPPREPDTLFVWQVAVCPEARGQGLAGRMVERLLARPSCRGVQRLRATITPGNTASWRLFGSIADSLEAPFSRRLWLDAEENFDGDHEDEFMITIGPFAPVSRAASAA